MRFSVVQGGLVRLGVSALALGLLAGAAMADDEVVVDAEVVIEDDAWVEDGEIVDDGGCIDCSGAPVDDGEIVIYEDVTGEDVTGEEVTDEEIRGDDGSAEPVEYLEDGEGGIEPELFPTSNCGGCEAWNDGGAQVLTQDDGVGMSRAYLNVLCTDPAFAGVSECKGFVAD
jgi:hypothetical protein